jgi:mannose-6-phosphate isomerase-like protein (cupin superfamily)
MDAFDISDLVAQWEQSDRLYLEFLRASTLSLGLYALQAGQDDPQKPHAEDEVYYVVEGKGAMQVGTESRPVGPGSIVFVGAGVEHRFHTITEDLSILVFFAPPLRSRPVSG